MKLASMIQKIVDIIKRPQWLIMAILAVVPGLFDFTRSSYNVFELNKQVFFIVFLLVILVLMMIRVVKTRSVVIADNVKILWPLLVLAIFLAVNTYLSVNPAQSFYGYYMRLQGALMLWYYWLWFALLIVYWTKAKQIVLALVAMVCGAIPVVTYGLVQHFDMDPLLWIESGAGRAFATLGQPNFLGAYLVVSIFLSLALWSQLTKRWQRILVMLAIAGQGYVLLYTYSRSAWVALVAGGVVYLVARALKARWYRRLIAALVLGCLLVGGLVVFNAQIASWPVAKHSVVNRAVSIFDLSYKVTSSKARSMYWRSGWEIYRQAPWLRKLIGHGKDSQRSLYVSKYDNQWSYNEKINAYPDRAHNNILDILIEFGLVGLVLYAVISIWIVARALRKYLQDGIGAKESELILWLAVSMVAYFVAHSFGFVQTVLVIYFYAVMSYLWFLGGSRQALSREIKNSKWFLMTVSALTIVFIILIAWQYNFKMLIADHYFMNAKKAEASYNCNGTLNNLNRVIEWQPMNLYYQEQYLYVYNNCLPSAASDGLSESLIKNILVVIDSIAQANYNYEIITNLAHSYSLMGFYVDKQYYERADEYYRLLVALTPNMLDSYQDWARMKLWAADYEAAERIVDQALGRYTDIDTQPDNHYVVATKATLAYLKQLKADSYYHRQSYQQALDMYRQIYEQFTSIDIYLNMADCYDRLGDKAAGAAILEEAYQQMPDDVKINLKLALIYGEMSDEAKAIKYSREVLRLDSDNPEALKIIADLEKVKK